MADKEEKEKLREALNEYFGRDVGDVDYTITESNICCGDDLREPERRITIITKPHKPTFEEKCKELVDQLDKDLREIDVDLSAKEANNGLVDIYIKGNKKPLFTVYGDADLPAAIQLCDAVLSFRLVKKVMSTITEFLRALNYLGRQYKDETI